MVLLLEFFLGGLEHYATPSAVTLCNSSSLLGQTLTKAVHNFVQWRGGGRGAFLHRHNNCGGALKVNDMCVCVGWGGGGAGVTAMYESSLLPYIYSICGTMKACDCATLKPLSEWPLKVHKIEIFFGFDFEICILSLLDMSKY
jgi:hypothetical protein